MEDSQNVRTIIFRIFLVIGYIGFGSGVFYVLERDQGSAEALKRLEINYNETMKIILKRCSTNDSELAGIMKEIHRTFLQHTLPKPWGFVSGLLTAVQVITTIGFGNTVPKTSVGRLFLIGYATIGIPLMAMMLTTIGGKIKQFIRSFIISFEKRVFKRRHPRNIAAKSVVATFALTATVHVVIASISTVIEGWSFSLSIYVWFVTLTTIGFGDYVPAGSGDESFIIIELIYSFGLFFLGLALVATILHALSDWINSKKPPTKEDIKRSIERITGHKGKADITHK